jgi:sugar phosphate isomerase/epimerase
MTNNRRVFLKEAGFSAASLLIFNELVGCKSKTNSQTGDSLTVANNLTGTGIEKFGIQLWTVKEDMAKDPKATLKALANYGYKQIESCDTGKGIFWGLVAADFKKYIDDLGLAMVSSHCNPNFTTKPNTADEFKKLADEAAMVGLKYLLNPFPGENVKTTDDFKKIAEGLNRQGEITKAAGLRTGYHNHHFEFLPLADGGIGEEILLQNTNPELVDFELDLYWNVKAGQQPAAWFTKYAGRFKLVHIKDLYTEAKVKEIDAKEKATGFWPAGASTELGKGRIDFPSVLSDAKKAGVEYFIVEQERFDGSTPLASAKLDAEYMNAFRFV